MCQAIYDYDAAETDELSFHTGECIEIVKEGRRSSPLYLPKFYFAFFAYRTQINFSHTTANSTELGIASSRKYQMRLIVTSVVQKCSVVLFLSQVLRSFLKIHPSCFVFFFHMRKKPTKDISSLKSVPEN